MSYGEACYRLNLFTSVPIPLQLVAGKARVVTVASIQHRTVRIKDAKAFLTDWRSGANSTQFSV